MYKTIPHLVILTNDEQQLRFSKVRELMEAAGVGYILVSSNSNKYYLTGRVFSGYILLSLSQALYYVKRPVELQGDNITYIRKPEEIVAPAQTVALELDELPFTTAQRLVKVLGCRETINASPLLAAARSTKTSAEIMMLMESGKKQEAVYRHIPGLYKQGMTDIELQIEIERLSRLEGCLGQFRISGDSMELFMGNVLAGDNADAPSPYDFAMGGAGMDPSIPVRADGTIIKHGMTVMVDVNGNYTGYMTDMTRVYRAGSINPIAQEAHDCSIEIHHALQQAATPGEKASHLFEMAMDIVKKHHLEEYFMGHRQHAGFIGHGVGIEINELPVIAPRSRDVLSVGNVIALEPKFVIPGTGAVGIENTYVLKNNGMECITLCPEEIVDLF